jgi:hypothetical protein
VNHLVIALCKSGVDVAKTTTLSPLLERREHSHVKGSLGKASIMNFKELPEGMAGVIPLFFRFRAKSNIVKPKTSISEEGFLLVFMDFTCTSVKFPWSMVFYLVFFGLF